MRMCGDCQVCCVVPAVPAMDKPPHTRCPKQCATGCAIFGEPERPQICLDFECAWKRGAGREQDRPDRIGAMFTINDNKVIVDGESRNAPIIFAIELEPNTISTTARSMAVAMIDKLQLPIVVVGSEERPPNDFGKHIAVNRQMMEATKQIRGIKTRNLAGHIGMYELNHGSSSG